MIREFCELDMNIYMYGRDPDQEYPEYINQDEELEICGKPVVMTLGALLPMSFGPNDMDRRGAKKVTKTK
jgi:cytidine deaminase